ncbi:helix-turn-helix domain-containing protein [Microbacterium sp. SORGH_AS_0888]|uniref:helix-turn-helix domain-containing protein n=1 Tax=Microbacterium sp. SORGH_AS_0888 TaxID=3041791 RepID=UPI00277F7C31|nr:helix-turn-helix domain-containing protein [Microbacterium sp. SORGH_AS_0888]MDQ1128291.1 transposase-like protein [Microbacterium sp. SORGH_AS_0888]
MAEKDAPTGGRAPIDEATRERIVQLAREGMSRNGIARETGVGATTVSRICKAEGVTFDRTQTAQATEAHRMDVKAERERLAERLLIEANTALDQLHVPTVVVGWYQGEATEHTLDRPTSGDVKNYMLAAAIALDKHIAIHQLDGNERDAAAVDLWLAHVMGGGDPNAYTVEIP